MPAPGPLPTRSRADIGMSPLVCVQAEKHPDLSISRRRRRWWWWWGGGSKLKLWYVLLCVMGRLCQRSEWAAAATHNLCSACSSTSRASFSQQSRSVYPLCPYLYLCTHTHTHTCEPVQRHKMRVPICICGFKFIPVYFSRVADLLVCLAASLWSLCLFSNGSSVLLCVRRAQTAAMF